MGNSLWGALYCGKVSGERKDVPGGHHVINLSSPGTQTLSHWPLVASMHSTLYKDDRNPRFPITKRVRLRKAPSCLDFTHQGGILYRPQ